MSECYLTKSLFNIGRECPRKVYYQVHSDLYHNNKVDDPFLEALAEGGFQVGALAKTYHPDGIDLSGLSPNIAIERTNELLKNEEVTVFEAAFKYKNLLVRVDIIKKVGNRIDLFEVKAKSFDSNNDHFLSKKDESSILADWAKYLYDVAYQTYVCQNSRSDLNFIPHLILVDKNSICTVNGLNQKFSITKVNGKAQVIVVDGVKQLNVGKEILIKKDVSSLVSDILKNNIKIQEKANVWDKLGFEAKVIELSRGLLSNQKLTPRLDKECKKCEFRCKSEVSIKNGFNECWSEKIPNNQLSKPSVFEIWHFNAEKVLKSGRYFVKDLLTSDFITGKNEDITSARAKRQWLQVEMIQEGNSAKSIDIPGLKTEISSWKYPLHFIDFETSRVAIPFTKGRRPYEQIAFQFSHHVMNEDGTILHADEYINAEPGVFPNFDFVRSLKKALEKDNGTIFPYSYHENTVLCEIIDQLETSEEYDKDDLIDWIQTITVKKKEWNGHRKMVDLCEIVKNCYLHPLMGGSNSLKSVLPAILQDSKFLQQKYEKPIYGALNGMQSRNFENQTWIELDQKGMVVDPYKSLPKLKLIEEEAEGKDYDALFDYEVLNNGGAAMIAYAKVQFTEMSDQEREVLRTSLLKYCELDTFAMVLLCEYFLNEVSIAQ